MNSNRLFFKGAKADFRREYPWFIMYAIIFLVLIPVIYLLGLQDVAEKAAALAESEPIGRDALFYNHAISVMGVNVLPVLIAAGLLEAYHSFGYLHRAREVDFYHALPGTRSQLFFGRFAGGMKMVLLPYTVSTALGFLCAVITGVRFQMLFRPVCVGLLLGILVFSLTYLTGILAVMLTGRALTGILGMLIFMGYFPLLASMLEELPRQWFVTYDGIADAPFLLRAMLELSPASQAVSFANVYTARYLMPFTYTALTDGFVFRVLACLAAALVLTVLNLKLYEKRHNEKAGEAMMFSKTEPVIRVLLVFFAALTMMLFMRGIGRSLSWVLFFTLAVTALGHIIVELIYRADPRKVLQHKAELCVMLAVSAAVVLGAAFDVFGVDRYLPEANKVDAAQITIQAEDGQYEIWQIDTGGDAQIVNVQSPETWKTAEGLPVAENVLRGETEIEAVRQIAQSGIRAAADQKERSSGMSMVYTEPDDGMTYTVNLTWTLKSGRQVRRAYHVPAEEMRDAYRTVCDDADYRAWLYPILSADPDRDLGELAYEENQNTVRLRGGARDQVLEAYKEDLRAMKMAEIDGKLPVAVLRIDLTEELLDRLQLRWLADDVARASRSGFRYGGETFFRYPVYDTFARTKEALAEAGISVGSSLKAITAFEYSGWAIREDGDEISFSGTITDPEELEVVRKSLVEGYLRHYNMYGPRIINGLEITWTSDGVVYAGWLLENEDAEALTDEVYRKAGVPRTDR